MKRAFAFALTLLVAGCGGSDNSSSGGYSCTVTSPDVTTCDRYGGSITATQVQNICKSSSGGVYSSSGCPKANLVGSCDVFFNGVDLTENFYAPTTQSAAQQLCEASSGTFNLAPGTVPVKQQSCGGTPSACATLTEDSCFSVGGCTYSQGGCTSALGSAISCSSLFFSQVSCDSTLDCIWDGSSCSGTIYTDLLTQTQCTQLNLDGGDATYTPAGCSGTPTTLCSTWETETFCLDEPGCSWS